MARSIFLRHLIMSQRNNSRSLLPTTTVPGISPGSSFLNHAIVEHHHCIRRRQRQERSYASASNSFWRQLHQEVQQGNGMQAEEMVNQFLRKQTTAANTQSRKLDTKLFSLVLQAWRNNKYSETVKSNAASRAHKLLEQMILLEEQGILAEPPRLQDYHAVLECYDASSSPPSNSVQCIDQILAFVADASTPITETTVELALSVLAKGGHAKEALQLLTEVSHQDGDSVFNTIISPTLDMYNSVLRAYAVQGNSNDAMALMQTLKSNSDIPNPDGTTYNIVIQCCCSDRNSRGVEQALALLDEMKALKIRRTLQSYAQVIAALAKQGEASRGEELLTRLVQDYGDQFDADLRPNLSPFQSVLWAYSISYHPNAAKRAQALLNHMRELHTSEILESPPNIWSYNIVLKCWSQSNAPDAPRKAKDLYEEMYQTNSIIPDATSMNTLLNVFANKTVPTETEELFWKLYHRYVQDPLQNPQPNVISFGTVLKAWAKYNNNRRKKSANIHPGERAEALFRKMEELHEAGWEQCKPDAVTFASLIQCWGSSKQHGVAKKAESILRKMQKLARAGDSDLEPDIVCWNSTIQAWAKAGNGERAEQLLNEMLSDQNSKSPKPNIITFTAVLSAWAKTRRYKDAPKRAQAILDRMEELHDSGTLENVKPNVVSYSILLDSLAYAKKKASAVKAEQILYEKMEQSLDAECKPNIVSYNSVIKAWSYVRDPSSVSKVTMLLEQLTAKSETDPRMTPNANTFGSVLKTLADSRLEDKAKRAEAVVQMMQKHDIVLNDWGKQQLDKCYTINTTNQSRQHQTNRKNSRDQQQRPILPEIPALKYS